jgi:hypothetical protein
MDGTQYFSSSKIHCPQCRVSEHHNGTVTYSHSVVTPVIVAPGKARVIPLEPEFITPQDGHAKQDCENVSDVPLRDGDDALLVNWCELTTTRDAGKVVYHNAFATNHAIDADTVRAGRACWKVKNANNNTPKTKGYHLTHNFGHGKQHLSALLATLNLLAFLFHTRLELFDSSYQRLRQFLPRKTFFDDLRALTRYLGFESWTALMAFMIRGLELPPPDTS